LVLGSPISTVDATFVMVGVSCPGMMVYARAKLLLLGALVVVRVMATDPTGGTREPGGGN
jgi:hypothetical protein